MACAKGVAGLQFSNYSVRRSNLRDTLTSRGAIFSSTSDTETILHSIARTPATDVVDAIEKVLKETEGAFSLLFLTPKSEPFHFQ